MTDEKFEQINVQLNKLSLSFESSFESVKKILIANSSIQLKTNDMLLLRFFKKKAEVNRRNEIYQLKCLKRFLKTVLRIEKIINLIICLK